VDRRVVSNEVVTGWSRCLSVGLALARPGVGMAMVDHFTALAMGNPAFSAHAFGRSIHYPVNAILLRDHQ
jgi:hypothetical protein